MAPVPENRTSPDESHGSRDDKSSSNATEDKEEVKTAVFVSVSELFQYATALDIFFMVVGTIASVGNGISQPLSFIVFGEMIDDFIDKESGAKVNLDDKMHTIALLYVYIAVGTLLCAYVQNTLWLLASIRQTFIIRTKCFQSIMRQDIGFFDTTDTGELSTRLADDITKIQTGIGDKIGSIVQALSMLLAGLAVGFYYSWKLTLVIMATAPLLMVTAFIVGKVISVITSEEQTAYAKAGGIAEEVLSSIRTVVAFNGEEKEIARYKEHLIQAEKAGVKKGFSTGFSFALFNIVIFSAMALGFWYGGTLIIKGEMTGGNMIIVFFSVMIGAAQLGQVGPNVEAFAVARGSAYYIYQLIHRKPDIDVMDEGGERPNIVGKITFKECKFNYPSRPDTQILRGFNLTIKNGTTCALVGESGCGKSTTVKLVQRFYDVTEGGVSIDGYDIKNLNLRHLRKHIGVVSQEPVLFDTSIKNNILLGNPEATEEMVEDAAKKANAHDFIKQLPQGYDTNTGEGGTQLSGGQKQRIAIARALIGNPRILLLDEATSALDTESESVVQAALEKASRGRTTIMIAHRLSTIKNADLIAVVSAGVIVEEGTHDELMAKRGEYFKLVMLQTFQERGNEDLENSEVTSLLSEKERDELMKLRSLSQISNKSDIEVDVSRSSIKRRKTEHDMTKEKGDGGKDSKKEEEIIEEEVKDIPSMYRIMKLNAKEWPWLVMGVFFAMLAGATPVAFAVIMSEALTAFTFKTNPAKIRKDTDFWALMFMAQGFGVGIGYLFAQYAFSVAGETLTTRLRESTFRALLRQEIAYFDRPEHSTGALAARLASDASAVQGATSTRLNTLTQMIVMGLSALIISFIYSWQLTLLTLAFVPLLSFAGAVQTKLNTSFAVDEQKKLAEAGSIATECIMQIRTVASLCQEQFFYEKYLSLLEAPMRRSKGNAHVFGLSFGSSFAIMFFSNAACFRLGGYLSESDGLTLADMMKVVMSIQFGAMTAGQLASFAPDYVKAKVSSGRILSLLDRQPEIDSYSTEGLKDEISGNIEFSKVQFSYPIRPDVPVLKGLSLKINRGQTVAFVGSSGCGKSTCVSLLERFYNIAEGVIALDGNPITEYNIKHLRSQIGIVQQEPVLFDQTIKENILYGFDQHEEGKVQQNDIEEACKKANIHHVIMELPQGYDTKVGDKGTLISGGQKQRIAIARALIRNPKILLLDEATSALDSESEKVVQDALDHAMEGRTSIIIAHRLSTIQNADVIAVLQDGKIVEVGNHTELLASKGAYYVLNQAQF